jgi:hypothetical protein
MFNQALQELYPNQKWRYESQDLPFEVSRIRFEDHSFVPDADAIEAKITEIQAEYDAQEYARSRKAEYPPIADQQDMQFHDAIDGTTTWQDAIQAVKNKYPKPE